jgi:hypothetical protein
MTATIIESETFEEIVADETQEHPCECLYHENEYGPASWAVVLKPWCCGKGGTYFWCDTCLQVVLSIDRDQFLGMMCAKCMKRFTGMVPRDTISHYEPIGSSS